MTLPTDDAPEEANTPYEFQWPAAPVEEDALLRMHDEHAQMFTALSQILDAWHAVLPIGWVATRPGDPLALHQAISIAQELFERIRANRSK